MRPAGVVVATAPLPTGSCTPGGMVLLVPMTSIFIRMGASCLPLLDAGAPAPVLLMGFFAGIAPRMVRVWCGPRLGPSLR